MVSLRLLCQLAALLALSTALPTESNALVRFLPRDPTESEVTPGSVFEARQTRPHCQVVPMNEEAGQLENSQGSSVGFEDEVTITVQDPQRVQYVGGTQRTGVQLELNNPSCYHVTMHIDNNSYFSNIPVNPRTTLSRWWPHQVPIGGYFNIEMRYNNME
ncbi:uncharacterized protein MYCFIDRAFT_211843 [Pseudocercospora fijiensis CIRAD86]|uniref:Uncharacterized protein n=1 Tax=Pseudocercospora fijiensis (strain CIRAD86) TaxID=383855 RepID=M3A9X4_PSEFD|nr:uncharacterized protein MYCFIDRAFT_211843 [Pseudocercospora fijiensis CIRAD86]EME81431.1 hypothetical protein MYCFIDRAFT_211843 [Pseudocercospora fijiensis CIRAD86]